MDKQPLTPEEKAKKDDKELFWMAMGGTALLAVFSPAAAIAGFGVLAYRGMKAAEQGTGFWDNIDGWDDPKETKKD